MLSLLTLFWCLCQTRKTKIYAGNDVYSRNYKKLSVTSFFISFKINCSQDHTQELSLLSILFSNMNRNQTENNDEQENYENILKKMTKDSGVRGWIVVNWEGIPIKYHVCHKQMNKRQKCFVFNIKTTLMRIQISFLFVFLYKYVCTCL